MASEAKPSSLARRRVIDRVRLTCFARCRTPPRRHEGGTMSAVRNPARERLERGAVPVGELTAALNAATLTVVMVETPAAIANVEEIAAVPGVDVVLVGTNDLAAEMGIPGDFANPRIATAYEKIIAACARHKKFPG